MYEHTQIEKKNEKNFLNEITTSYNGVRKKEYLKAICLSGFNKVSS